MFLALVELCLLLQAEPLAAAPVQAASAPAAPAQTAPSQAEPTATAPTQASPAQAAADQPPAAASLAGKTVRLPAGTLLEVELVAPLSSTTSHLGDKFAVRLAAPISSDGVEVVAAGAAGEGEVIDAAPAGMAGAAGKLILSSRRLDLNGHSVRIRGMTLMKPGQSRSGLVSGLMFVPYVGLASGFVRGNNVQIPAGARYTVKLAEDLELQSNPPIKIEGTVH